VTSSRRRGSGAILLLLLLASACVAAKDASVPAPPVAAATSAGDSAVPVHDPAAHAPDPAMQMLPAPVIPADANYSAADVRFMQGMIAHHGQAVQMARMAESHGANAQLLKFTQKIDQSQRGEIKLMQWWLGDRDQVVPDSNSHHSMTMPGMLTAEQLKQLDAARGKAFDKLFLIFMIQHHEGALKMVADLQASPRSMQEIQISSFATDVETDQSAEILKMNQMLAEMN